MNNKNLKISIRVCFFSKHTEKLKHFSKKIHLADTLRWPTQKDFTKKSTGTRFTRTGCFPMPFNLWCDYDPNQDPSEDSSQNPKTVSFFWEKPEMSVAERFLCWVALTNFQDYQILMKQKKTYVLSKIQWECRNQLTWVAFGRKFILWSL